MQTNALVSNESRLPSQLKTPGCSARGGGGAVTKRVCALAAEQCGRYEFMGGCMDDGKRGDGDGGPAGRRHRTPCPNARAIIQSSPKLVNFEIRANALHPLFFYFFFFTYARVYINI